MKKMDMAWVACAFLLVLFLNAYFNLTSGVALNEDGTTVEEKFYLAGPDPYYNMRLVVKTMENGTYPFIGGAHGGLDPLLNYPLGGTGGRPPLFNMLTIGVGKFLTLFMDETDAIGYAMQFLPALYGALLVIPVYFIGKLIFNRKVGIISALFIALIPIHLSSGHGSAYSLYDHDSFILLLSTTSLMFLIMSLKEKNVRKSVILATFSGVFVAAVTMTWVSSQYIYAVIAVYGIVQMIMDIFTKRISVHVVRSILIPLFTGYILSFPILWVKYGLSLSVHFFIPVAVAIFSIIYLWIGKKNIPWIISIPSIAGIGAIGLGFLYLIRNTTNPFLMPLTRISDVVFGRGIYGSKVSLTIAEAVPFDLSRTAMSFGPAFYLLGWAGFLYLIYLYYKKKWPREYMMMITWFAIEIWLVSIAGRFLNDLVPLMAILGSSILWITLVKIDFSSMIKTIKGLGSGWYGIKKGIKIRHIVGVFFIVLFVMFPNSWLAFDASLPSTMKQEFQTPTQKLGAFGLGLYTEKYWTEAFTWLKNQNKGINETEKPAFVSWWDYGFYCVAIGKNPTVADNFQEGIPAAANLHTSENERQATAVLIVRIAQGGMNDNGGKVSDEMKQVFEKYLGNKSNDLIQILEDPAGYENSSVGKIVGEKYGGERFKVREENAVYHDSVKILTELDDENLTMLYRELKNVTGYDIRYYGVEGYDINIFNVFTFLADKGVYGYETTEDRYYKLWYVAENTGQRLSPDEVRNITRTMSQKDIREIYGRFNPYVERKGAFFDSMVYRIYVGNVSKDDFEWGIDRYRYNPYLPQLISPTANLKHFVVEFISNKYVYYPRPGWLCTGCPAVVIAKYYEGARINGRLESEGMPLEGIKAVIEQDVTIFNVSKTIPHDSTLTDENGEFSLIAPAGNISLSFYSGDVLIKKITFNSNGTFSPISEEEATRVKFWEPETWTRNLGTINIERGGIKGIVYWDKDGDKKYNASIDEPVKAKVKIGDKEISTGSNGKYEVKKLLPDKYTVTAIKGGYDAESVDIVVEPNKTIWHNISLIPSQIEVKGRVWYDENGNGKIDENETISNVPISFTITKALDQNAENDTAKSDANGNYTIMLYPSKYRIEVDYTVRNTTYYYEGIIDLKIGDKTKVKNIKLARKE